MRQYIDTNIMSNNASAKVTAYLEHPINGFGVYVGELVTPYAANTGTFNRFDNNIYSSNVYIFRRATLKTIAVLGTQSGNALGTANGSVIATEDQS